MERIIYVPFDQLNVAAGAMKIADKATDHIVLVESQRMVTARNWHKQRLLFILSSARHFAKELTEVGWNVTYLKSATTIDGLHDIKQKYPGAKLGHDHRNISNRYRRNCHVHGISRPRQVTNC